MWSNLWIRNFGRWAWQNNAISSDPSNLAMTSEDDFNKYFYDWLWSNHNILQVIYAKNTSKQDTTCNSICDLFSRTYPKSTINKDRLES